jgi:hypothetical protein
MPVKRNIATIESGYDQADVDGHVEFMPYYLGLMNDDNIADERKERTKEHFFYILGQDMFKNALTAEQITEMESYLPENYQDDYIN